MFASETVQQENVGRNSLPIYDVSPVCSLELLEEDGDLLAIGRFGGVEKDWLCAGRHGTCGRPTARDACE